MVLFLLAAMARAIRQSRQNRRPVPRAWQAGKGPRSVRVRAAHYGSAYRLLLVVGGKVGCDLLYLTGAFLFGHVSGMIRVVRVSSR